MIFSNIREKVTEICNNIDEINTILISSQQIHGVIKLNPDEESHLLNLISSVKNKISTLNDDTIFMEDDFIQYINMISRYMKSIEEEIKKINDNKWITEQLNNMANKGGD